MAMNKRIIPVGVGALAATALLFSLGGYSPPVNIDSPAGCTGDCGFTSVTAGTVDAGVVNVREKIINTGTAAACSSHTDAVCVAEGGGFAVANAAGTTKVWVDDSGNMEVLTDSRIYLNGSTRTAFIYHLNDGSVHIAGSDVMDTVKADGRLGVAGDVNLCTDEPHFVEIRGATIAGTGPTIRAANGSTDSILHLDGDGAGGVDFNGATASISSTGGGTFASLTTAGTAQVATGDVRTKLSNAGTAASCSGSTGAVCVDDAGGLAIANGSGTVNATVSAAGAISAAGAVGSTGASVSAATFLAITTVASLPTCEAGLVGRVYLQQGGGTTIRSRLCLCTSDGNAPTAVFAWQDLATGTVDDDESCDA